MQHLPLPLPRRLVVTAEKQGKDRGTGGIRLTDSLDYKRRHARDDPPGVFQMFRLRAADLAKDAIAIGADGSNRARSARRKTGQRGRLSASI
jgi:hypothetical protein